jgi:hypothetical protein
VVAIAARSCNGIDDTIKRLRRGDTAGIGTAPQLEPAVRRAPVRRAADARRTGRAYRRPMVTVLLMIGLLVMTAYLVAFAVAQVLGEHEDNVDDRRRHHRALR